MKNKVILNFVLAFLLSILFNFNSRNIICEENSEIEFVKVLEIKLVKIPVYYEAVGTIVSKASSILSSKVSGHIKQIKVKEGDKVSMGDVLILIDDRDISAKVGQAKAGYEGAQKTLNEIDTSIKQAKAQKQQAQANLTLAKTTYERTEKLFKEKLIGAGDFDAAKAKLEIAKAQITQADEAINQGLAKKQSIMSSIEQAKSGLDETNVLTSYTKITAPFNGVIIKKHVDIGSLASQGIPLLTIEDSQNLRLEVDVREQEFANKVEMSRKIKVKIDSLGDAHSLIDGEIAEIVPSANPLSRTFKVKISLPNISGLTSGMYGKAMCPRNEREGILIPENALIKRGQLEQVFAIDQDKACLKLVKSGKKFDKFVEILSGLKIGDNIIISSKNSLSNLKDGVKIKIDK